MTVRPTLVVVCAALCACRGAVVQGVPDASSTGALDAGVDASPDAGPDALPDVAPDRVAEAGPEASTRVDPCTGPTVNAWLSDPSLCVVQYAGSVAAARQIAFAPNGDLFVAQPGLGITVLHDDDHNGTIGPTERSQFTTTAPNHAVGFSPDHRWLYASSDTTVWRWPYRDGLRVADAPATVVVRGMPGGGNHPVRPFAFLADGSMLVMVGSAGNLDDSDTLHRTRAAVRRFVLTDPLPAGGADYASAELYATGLRNEVGLFVDARGRVLGVENGCDDLTLGGMDVHLENPGEEINWINRTGTREFGYPSCWSEGTLAAPMGLGATTQHAEQRVRTLARTDAWCRDLANVAPPLGLLPAHWAPLGIVEYTGTLLPAAWRGSLFVTSHGSWNHAPLQVGRLVARVPVNPDGSLGSAEVIFGQTAGGAQTGGGWNVRPVDVDQGPDGALYVSDDRSGQILRIAARNP